VLQCCCVLQCREMIVDIVYYRCVYVAMCCSVAVCCSGASSMAASEISQRLVVPLYCRVHVVIELYIHIYIYIYM